MDCFVLLRNHAPSDLSYDLLVVHSCAVAGKAARIGERIAKQGAFVNFQFLEEAAMLHDIGVYFTNATKVGGGGTEPYIRHGVLGGKLLRELGYPKHARVAERHTGVGITKEDIVSQGLPLPKRDFVPITLEEQIICYVDKFFSKSDSKALEKEKSVEEIVQDLSKFGEGKVEKFLAWRREFEGKSQK
ncbi:MAG: HD domain-containing protein [bacterium]